MIRKIAPYILAVLIAVGIFIFGFATGIKFFGLIKGTTMLQDKFIESTQTMSALNYLDKGEVEKARQFLLLNQDAIILGINGLAENADKQSYETACNIITRIAKHRKDNPEKYSAYIYTLENEQSPDIRKEVARILHKWDSCRNKK